MARAAVKRRPTVAGVGGPIAAWPVQMRCMPCHAEGYDVIGRIYPFPYLEDGWPANPDDVGTIGTFWCPRCMPPWGAFLLEQLTIRSIGRWGFGGPTEPAIPVPGGLPVDDIAFLESELADFFETPGPLLELRPHHIGPGPRAQLGEDFETACWLLVGWMRQAKVTGYVTGNDLGRPGPLLPLALSNVGGADG